MASASHRTALSRRIRRNGPLVAACLLALAIGGAYLNSLHGVFLFDDYSCIVENPAIRRLWPLHDILVTRPDIAIAGRPLVTLSLALNYAVGGLDVVGYHVVNIGLHLISALLLFGLVRRALRTDRWRETFGRSSTGLALAVALLWGVHPLLTEGVTYIVQRTELMMSLCLLLMVYAILRSTESSRPWRWQAVAIVACGAGMASKEVMVVGPFVAWLFDALVLSAAWSEPWRRRRGLYLGLAATWLILAALLSSGPRPASVAWGVVSPWDSLTTQAGVLLHYARLAVWPDPLVVDYGDWPIATRLREVWPACAAVGACWLASVWLCARRRLEGFLCAWVLLILAPSSSILPIVTEVAAERRMYLPLAGLISLAVFGGWRLLRRAIADLPRRRVVSAALVASVAMTLGALAARRNATYVSEVALLEDTVRARPSNTRARYNLGTALAEQGWIDQARREFEQVLALNPAYAPAHNNLGVMLLRQGHANEAAQHYAEAIRLDPTLADPYNNLGELYAGQGQAEAARALYATAVRLNPSHEPARRHLQELRCSTPPRSSRP